MARIGRAIELSTSLTFRAVPSPRWTLACRPLGLDTALTSFPVPLLPGQDAGVPGGRCRREASTIMPAGTDILSAGGGTAAD